MSGLIIVIVLFFAVIAIVWLAAAKLGLIKSPPDAKPTPAAAPVLYIARKRLLSAAESSFHSVLLQSLPILTAALQKDAPPLVFAKVRLADILETDRTGDSKQRTTATNRIISKHVDFVLADPASTRPLLLLELDDASHNRPDRKARDEFLDQAAAAAKLPILHVKAAHTYAPRALATDLARAMGLTPAAA